MPHGYIQAYSCRPIMLCNIKYAHAVPANAGGLIDYSLYSSYLEYPQNDHFRQGGEDQPLSLLTQSFIPWINVQ